MLSKLLHFSAIPIEKYGHAKVFNIFHGARLISKVNLSRSCLAWSLLGSRIVTVKPSDWLLMTVFIYIFVGIILSTIHILPQKLLLVLVQGLKRGQSLRALMMVVGAATSAA